ncbi:MAG: chemotaxis protein CheA [Spirochaetia bacterium]|nr:chemotaxis protein CheA [Spirochaetia bacterium]
MADQSEYYREEARELLELIEQKLIDLENQPEDTELLHAIFRAFHTIKGSGSMFGYDEVAGFTHEIETLFDYLRDKRISSNKQIIDIALAAKDHISDLIFSSETIDPAAGESILKSVRSYLAPQRSSSERSKESTKQPAPPPVTESVAENDALETTFRITISPQREFFLRGAKVLPLLQELEALGTPLIFAHTGEIPALEQIDPELCYTSWTILLTTTKNRNAIQDIFIFVEDYSELHINVIDDAAQLDITSEYKRIGEILYEQGYVDQETVESIMKQKERFGEVAMKQGVVSKDAIDSALGEQQYVREVRRQRQQLQSGTTIRVKSEKLDDLVNLVGEIVTLQARLAQYTESARDGDRVSVAELENVSENMDRLTSELRENTMDIRMIPLAETFNSFHRLVRDLSAELGKEVELVTSGAETELDKNIIDALNDPLVHIIRNSIDHGLESSEERQKAGKAGSGTVSISAEHSGANVLIRIKDDGQGLSSEKIRKKAVQRGIISKDSKLSDRELYSLIFSPGFSTTETATSVSGRGVGMDVVKRNIEQLRGKVHIDSQPNLGTTITLTIPLTLSIIDGLLVSIGLERYVINLSAVEECFELTPDLFPKGQRNEYLSIRGEIVPYIDLRELFAVQAAVPQFREITVVKAGESKVALIVDSIIGQHQTVIKPLNAALNFIQEVSGSTILGDGTIAFILDINKLTEKISTGV